MVSFEIARHKFISNFEDKTTVSTKHHIVILAGGPGSRLWPESKPDHPKPFLNFPKSTDPTLLSQSLSRALSIVPEKNVWLVMHQKYKHLIEKQHQEMLGDRILLEPEAKNTAPAMLFASLKIKEIEGPNAVVTFLPCDHYIQDLEKFSAQIRQGFKIAEEQNKIVTYGVEPFYPSSSYGYIKTKIKDGTSCLMVEKFTEKPSVEKAKEFISKGGYYWNSGIFTFSVSTFLKECEKNLSHFEKIKSLKNSDLAKLYDVLPSISIDYALMEKCQEIVLIPASFVWSDIGTWGSIKKMVETENAIDGEGFVISGENNYIRSKKPVYLCGLDHVFVIQTDNETLIISEDQLDRIGEIGSQFSKKIT